MKGALLRALSVRNLLQGNLINSFKRNKNTFRISSSTICASLVNRGQLLKERICFSRSNFFLLRVDPLPKGCELIKHSIWKRGRRCLLEQGVGIVRINMICFLVIPGRSGGAMVLATVSY